MLSLMGVMTLSLRSTRRHYSLIAELRSSLPLLGDPSINIRPIAKFGHDPATWTALVHCKEIKPAKEMDGEAV